MISTVAGELSPKTQSVSAATSGFLRHPGTVAVDSTGAIFIADTGNNLVRKITPNGIVSNVAGSGTEGYAGDGAPALNAELDRPAGVTLAQDGSIYIADTHNHCIRRVLANGTITTVAGVGSAGFAGDGARATLAKLRLPSSIVIDSQNNVFIADTGNHRIRCLTQDGNIHTVAGSGEQGNSGDGGPALAAALDSPTGLALDSAGRLLIADRRNDRVRVVDQNGIISTLSVGTSQKLGRPVSISADDLGNIFVAESAGHQIRQVNAGMSSVVLGNGLEGPFIAGADPLDTSLASLAAIAPAPNGGMIVSDSGHNQIQQVTLPFLDFGEIPAGTQSQPRSLLLHNKGTAPLTVSAVLIPRDFVTTSASTCGTLPRLLSPDESCTLSLAFAPGAQGTQTTKALVQGAGIPPQAVLLTGRADAPGTRASSSTTMHAAGTIAYAGSALSLVAHVLGSIAVVPGGAVLFHDGPVVLGQATVDSSGSASFVTTTLGLGAHVLDAAYAGNNEYQPSTSPAITVAIAPTPDFTIRLAGLQDQSFALGETANVEFVLQPQNGPLGKPVQLNVVGLPGGWHYSFSPAEPTLASDPVNIMLAISTQQKASSLPFAGLVCASLICWFGRRHRTSIRAFGVGILLLGAGGCGGGYLGNTSSANTKGLTYPLTISATTAGITGGVLVHSVKATIVVH